MANRHWRVNGNFHSVGDLVVLVVSPNWQGALRKAALAIKALPQLKGKRLKAGSFTIVEVEAPALAEVVANAQLPLPSGPAEPEQGGGGQTPPSIAE